MSKTATYLIPVLFLSICAFISQIHDNQLNINAYDWAANTLRINVVANRQAWRACKRFKWCDERHSVPKWEVVWRGEHRYLA